MGNIIRYGYLLLKKRYCVDMVDSAPWAICLVFTTCVEKHAIQNDKTAFFRDDLVGVIYNVCLGGKFLCFMSAL